MTSETRPAASSMSSRPRADAGSCATSTISSRSRTTRRQARRKDPRSAARAPRASRSCCYTSATRGCTRTSPRPGRLGCARSTRAKTSSTPAPFGLLAQWCTFEITAQRPASSPSATHISQSGFARSSCWDITLPTRSRNSSSPPAAGSAVRRTWYSRLKCGSSTHAGRPSASRHEPDLVPISRNLRQPGGKRRLHLARTRRRGFEDAHRADVHV